MATYNSVSLSLFVHIPWVVGGGGIYATDEEQIELPPPDQGMEDMKPSHPVRLCSGDRNGEVPGKQT